MLNETKYYLVRAAIAHDFTPDLYACVKIVPEDIQRIRECLASVAGTELMEMGMSGLTFSQELHPIVINETTLDDVLGEVYPELESSIHEKDYAKINEMQYNSISAGVIPTIALVSVDGVTLECHLKGEKVSMYVCPTSTSDRYYLLAMEKIISNLIFPD